MLRNIRRWFKQLWQRLFGNSSTSPDVPPPEPPVSLTDAEYEAIFLQLLEWVSKGWGPVRIQGILTERNIRDTDLIPWLQRFGERLQESPTLHEPLVRRLLLLANLNLGELSQVAGEIGRNLGGQPEPPKPNGNNDEAEAWLNQGNEQYMRGDFLDAIASYDQAIKFKPYYHQAWNNRGLALDNLGELEKAIASYDKALEFKPDDHQAWLMAGQAVGKLSQYQLQSPYLLTLHNPILKQWGYNGAITIYAAGLEQCQQDTHPEGWGRLHHFMGRAHYFQGRRDIRNRHLWREAVKEYNLALQTLTPQAYPELHLEVLQDYLKILFAWKATEKAQQIQRDGTDLFNRLLAECKSPAKKQQLERQFASFRQLTVDIIIQSGEPIAALELAEQGKNTCLSWFLDIDQSPTYSEIQQLLTPTTAIVYWHLSPIALHTFLLTPDAETPRLISSNTPQTETQQAIEHLQRFETWLETWNEQYNAYRKTKEQEIADTTWRDNLVQHLTQLQDILNIPAILAILKASQIQHLVLIPHRNLHLLPLHTLFSSYLQKEVRDFTISYLPSAKAGIERQACQTSKVTQPLLCIKHPGNDPKNRLLFADVEAPAVAYLHQGTRIEDRNATKTNVLEQIQTSNGYLHFTCHGEHDFKAPQNSALELQDELLTFAEIQQLKLLPYELVCLSACETGLTSNYTITDEFVGLASAFLAAGTTYVMSTLWSVDDIASALFIIKFYELLKTNLTNPPAALDAAQTWMRTLTYADLIPWCENRANEIADYDHRCRINLKKCCR
ncbi:MAG: CHAT domain-containing protein [Desertifilum sp.]|nr:CHAT domain-containing protein [Desertifilum sp.]